MVDKLKRYKILITIIIVVIGVFVISRGSDSVIVKVDNDSEAEFSIEEGVFITHTDQATEVNPDFIRAIISYASTKDEVSFLKTIKLVPGIEETVSVGSADPQQAVSAEVDAKKDLFVAFVGIPSAPIGSVLYVRNESLFEDGFPRFFKVSVPVFNSRLLGLVSSGNFNLTVTPK